MSPDRRLILLLAARADCNVKTARRALVDGVDAIKGANLRERLRKALAVLRPSPRATDTDEITVRSGRPVRRAQKRGSR